MIARVLATALWACSTVLLVTAGFRYARTRSDLLSVTAGPSDLAIVGIPDAPSSDSLNGASERATGRNPFRPDRLFADSTAPSLLAGQFPPVVPGVPPSVISVRGILGGPPWTAVIQGVPGTPGPVVMRMGDTIGGYTLVRVRRDTVVMRSAAGAITLTLSAR